MVAQPKSRARSQSSRRKHDDEALFVFDEIIRLRTWGFAQCALGQRAGALIVTLLGTAARCFEAAALRTGDIRMGLGGPEVFFPQVKGGGTATVPISDETFTALRVWIGERSTSSPLIPTAAEEFMHRATLWRLYRQALTAAGIKRETGVHATRHAAGYLLLQATGDLTKVQTFLRHTTIATTDGWYKHVHMPDLRAGIKKAGL